MQNNEKGFTIVEILVGIVLVTILGYLLYQSTFKDSIDAAHGVAVSHFLSSQAPRAIYSCSLKYSNDLTECDKAELTDSFGLPDDLSVGGWATSTPNNYSIEIAVGFSGISTPTETMDQIIETITSRNIGAASRTGASTITVVYNVK